VFQGQCIVTSRLSKNGATWGQSYCRTLIGNHTQSIEWYHLQSPHYAPPNNVTRESGRRQLISELKYCGEMNIVLIPYNQNIQ